MLGINNMIASEEDPPRVNRYWYFSCSITKQRNEYVSVGIFSRILILGHKI